MRDRRRAGRLATGVLGCVAILAVATVLGGCAVSATPASSSGPSAGSGILRYVALGDSYTIGTSVAPVERFPDQLVAALGPQAPTLILSANLAVDGYSSRDLIDTELPALDALQPEFVSVLIGVNDVVQGVSLATYEANAVTILDDLLERLPAERVVVVAIPDYTVTPQGAAYGEPQVASAGIQAENAAMARLAAERAIPFVDIFHISREAETDRSLVADDGLHPSGAQYLRWVEALLPVVEAAIGR